MCVAWVIFLREILPECVRMMIRETELEYGVGSLHIVNVSANANKTPKTFSGFNFSYLQPLSALH